MRALRLFACALAAVGVLSGPGAAQAAVITTADLVSVSGGPVFAFSVGGWTGGGLVTGSFAGTDLNTDGQLSFFDGEVTAFSVAYSGGAVVGPIALGFGDLFGLVYDFDGDIGDGLILDIEGIGASGGGVYFAIGPGPVGICGTGAVCGIIDGPAAAVPEAPVLPLIMSGLAAVAARRRRKV